MDNKIVIGIVIGIVVGLIVGLVLGSLLILPTATTKTGTETNNHVRVSGTIQEQNPYEISFSNENGQIQTSEFITNGQYSVVLVGNQSYVVKVTYGVDNELSDSYSIYVPSGVTTFTANF